MNKVKAHCHKLFEKIQNSSHVDLSKIHSSVEVSDLVESELAQFDSQIQFRLKQEFFKWGPLTQLISDQDVTEIMVNGPSSIWFEKNGKIHSLPDEFLSPVTYRNFILRLCQESRIQTHLAQPCADGYWQEFRVHLIQPPLVKADYHLCLRRHPDSPWTLQQLEDHKWCPPWATTALRKLSARGSNILIVGPTGTGKTSVMNALLQQVQSKERVIIIEDTDELKVPNDISLKLLTRQDSGENLKDFSQSELLRQALRMRPQRLALGEVRGAEAKDLLMAFATGHSGGLCTLHAQSAQQALLRLEMLIQMGAPQWTAAAIRQLIKLSLQYIVEIEMKEGQRQMKAIQRIASLEHTGFCLEKLDPSNPYIKI